jgi:hypothetical protein
LAVSHPQVTQTARPCVTPEDVAQKKWTDETVEW